VAPCPLTGPRLPRAWDGGRGGALHEPGACPPRCAPAELSSTVPRPGARLAADAAAGAVVLGRAACARRASPAVDHLRAWVRRGARAVRAALRWRRRRWARARPAARPGRALRLYSRKPCLAYAVVYEVIRIPLSCRPRGRSWNWDNFILYRGETLSAVWATTRVYLLWRILRDKVTPSTRSVRGGSRDAACRPKCISSLLTSDLMPCSLVGHI